MRKNLWKILPRLILLWLLLALPAMAQDLEALLERYAEDNAPGYVRPLITGFGAGLNSGLFHSAYIPKSGIHAHLHINVMAALYSDEQRVFQATTSGAFTPPSTIEAPTIVGSGEGAVATGIGGTEFRFPGGFDMTALALAVPTLTVGSVQGTELLVRYLSATVDDEIGKVTLFGIGGRHSISQYIPDSPVDIAVGYAYNSFDVDTVFSTDIHAYHLEVGKRFSVLELYGGLAGEQNNASVNYVLSEFDSERPIDIDVEGRNKFRVTLGFALHLSVFHLNMDYHIGRQNLVNAGMGFGF